ncbi:EthD domain-containing protein [Sorangium sp. So ce388]|uniref:EthD domain-containing protein n=1 Tax=Sorangium sp. So ce388 TaxID=3133309 RepID=UPI003F5B4C55
MGYIDHSIRDRNGKLAFYVLLWRRRGISLAMFDDYWKNVHGPVCARLPGQEQYWQFHLDRGEGGLLPDIPGVDLDCPEGARFDGIAELSFATEEDRATWLKAAAILMDDEHNLFRKAIGYTTSAGNSRTFVDCIENGAPNGAVGVVKLHVMLRKAPQIDVPAFRAFLTERLAPAVAGSERVLKLRLHLFDEVDSSRPDAPGVVHREAPEEQYQAAFEVAFATRLDMEAFFASDAFARVAAELGRHVSRMRPFLERTAHTFVHAGRMTTSGQRGSMVAELIEGIGAVNQLEEDVVDLMLTGRLAGSAGGGRR